MERASCVTPSMAEFKASTLHLPRILCLHGGGTNARIFRMQCRVLERNLRPYFRLVYAEAPFPARPGPDVTAAYKEYGPFKAWLRVRPDDPIKSADEVVQQVEYALDAARDEDDRQGATGEWVAVLGFSQGAKLAASILANQQELRRRAGHSTIWPECRFAVLLAGRGPLVWLHPELPMPMSLVDAAQCTTDVVREQDVVVEAMQNPLQIPTIHVHGLNDPGLELHRRLLYQYCGPRNARLIEWDGNHRVPIKAKDVQPVVEQMISMARRTGAFNG